MPDARNGREKIPRVLQLTYKAVTPFCTCFDSTLVTKYPAKGGDGVHYWFPAALPIAKSWAEAAFEAMTPLLRKLPAGKE